MMRKSVASVLSVGILLAGFGFWLGAAGTPTHAKKREDLLKAYHAGNFKDAYDGLRKLALEPGTGQPGLSQDLTTAIHCLQRLGRVDEIDAFREAVIKAHAKDWRLLQTAAQTYLNVEHHGYIVAGKFHRGWHRGGGRYVNGNQRDRVRALQLLQQGLPLTKGEKDRAAVASYHLLFATTLLGAGYYEPWRLQTLTDLGTLPDYEDGWYYYRSGTRGAPVDADGKPVYHRVPKSYKAAATDGQRWRWMLTQAAELDPKRLSEIEMIFANFLRSQFGVGTMQTYGRFRTPDTSDGKTGTFALATLGDDETIARLANGLKRFKLPDEFNFITIYRRVAGRGKSSYGEQARDALANIFEDRRQYDKAAGAWKKVIAEYGTGHQGFRQKRLDQIVANWGRFEPIQNFPAGQKAAVDFRFRNGDKVSFEAHAIHVAKLLDDVKAYLSTNPARPDWERTNIGNLGYRLVEKGEKTYLGAKVASWDLKLKPRPGHVDDRVTVTTPLTKPGAYLLTAKMAGGNLSRIIVWVSDSVIVKKNLDNAAYYYVADAASGKPLPRADVEFFGWRQVPVAPGAAAWRVETATVKGTVDADGQIILGGDKLPSHYQWLITARKKGFKGAADRFAYLGFTYAWYNRVYDPEYNATKVFTITDRPVYRPEQKVEFKFWVRHAKYDEPDASDFADKSFTVRIFNPRGEKVLEKGFTSDAYGGIAGEFPLPKGAMLGNYSLQLVDHGSSSFRVEEYKKPEFEVQVEAPKEPVRLGETITATIKAKYYFGAPVTKAKVKYKVQRTGHDGSWYPRGRWDWFYGRGYWWFAPDIPWFPGWRDWGMKRPVPIWWRGRGFEPPEIVLENEVPIGPDGVVKVVIDTKPAKELNGDQDHKYVITAEVVDESRRTITGGGEVLVARKPFQVYAWVDRGHYRVGDTVKARFNAQTLDGNPVEGKGEVTLYQISYEDGKPVEKPIRTWKVDTNVEGKALQQLKASFAGQFRISYQLTDSKKHTIEGGYLFVVRGAGFDGSAFKFNDLELITDKREYAPGDKVQLMVNTNQLGGTVLLFVRPTNGVYLKPRVLRLRGKSINQDVDVVKRDMPNFFIEALTVSGGRVHTETREVVVPPEKRVLEVAVLPSQAEYKPGQKATVKVKLTDYFGKPFVGSTVLSIYDKSVEYISGGTNVPEIREYFWKWRRHHYPHTEASVGHYSGNILRTGEIGMGDLGIFGGSVVEEFQKGKKGEGKGDKAADKPGAAGLGGPGGFGGRSGANKAAGTAPPMADEKAKDGKDALRKDRGGEQARRQAPGKTPPAPPGAGTEPHVRKNFADTALWRAALTTDKDGVAEVSLTMPENLTGWKVKVWAMGHGTKVGQGEAEVTTKKDLLVRLQAPRFFVQKDEVVLSANVHNYLKGAKKVKVSLELEGGTLSIMGNPSKDVTIPAAGEKRVDWRVKVIGEGIAVVRMKAVTDEDADAMQMSFPCYVHGMLKTDSYSGVVRGGKSSATVALSVPKERRVKETRLEIRYSPTLAGAMVDALPYMVEYPYGCTEQTLNRFLPTIITQRILLDMKLDLKAIQKKRTNLNAQEIGDDKERARGWKRFDRNPVFDQAEVQRMVQSGIDRLESMHCSDGGWGWFSGFGERSYPHTTAVVVHGLQIAKEAGVKLPANMLERGVEWLRVYQQEQIQRLQNAPTKTLPWKDRADNLDAFIYMVLVDAGVKINEMRDFLYRDRIELAVYAKAMFALALEKQQDKPKLAMLLKNIKQFLVEDDENQTAYLKMPAANSWWYWYGSEIESDAYYLKLLSRTDPKGEVASRLVKYLLNNRKHATYWNSTRDTAVCIEAMAEYLKASGEDKPDQTVQIFLDGKKVKEVKVDSSNLFTFDNKLVLEGEAVSSGKHKVEVKRQGKGPVYFNAYLTNFTLEDFITKAGLEVKVNRKYYKLTRVDKKVKAPTSDGRPVDRKVEKYKRTELANLAELKSGDLVEVELEIDSKNDYEYLIFEDPKAAGFEPVLVRSGYNANDMGAYMELRDDRVCFFVRALARGKHSVSYRLRAEIPGRFSALPTRGYAMYAPELKGNSDEIKLVIED